jgi:heme O synthase-like polyprenyltransferase
MHRSRRQARHAGLAAPRIPFSWQCLHFMSIAWMYRQDYGRAGYRIPPMRRLRDSFIVWMTIRPLLSRSAAVLSFRLSV